MRFTKSPSTQPIQDLKMERQEYQPHHMIEGNTLNWTLFQANWILKESNVTAVPILLEIGTESLQQLTIVRLNLGVAGSYFMQPAPSSGPPNCSYKWHSHYLRLSILPYLWPFMT